VRGGLDDALDKLARRDELRRRTAGEATGTSPAVQELAEAIAGVVGRNPRLAVTVGVEGSGDPVLLHFAVENGTVQVTVDNSVASRIAEAAPRSPRHADFDIDVDDPADEPAYVRPTETAWPADTVHTVDAAHAADAGEKTRRISYDDRERFGYSESPYGVSPDPTATPAHAEDPYRAEPVSSDRRYEGHRRYDDDFTSPDFFPTEPAEPYRADSDTRDRFGPDTFSRTNGATSTTADGIPYPPHPFAATPPPPVPPQTRRRAHTEQHRAAEEPSAAERQRLPEQPAPQRGMPTPLPNPIPLKVDTEETELAAKRLAALLRDNPSLLRQSPID
jgi:hypothetical protein